MQQQTVASSHPAPSRDVEPERLLYTIKDAQRALGGLGRSTIYRMIDAGRIRKVKIAGRVFLKADEVHRLASEGETATAAE